MRDQLSTPITIPKQRLSLDNIIAVSRGLRKTEISQDPNLHTQLQASRQFIENAVDNGDAIYGVTSGFGGLAHIAIPREDVEPLQNNLTWFHQVGTGDYLPDEHARGAMLLVMNALMQGKSGIRFDIIERLNLFLNNQATPKLFDLISIGASGDLCPLSYITACLIGSGPSWKMQYKGEVQSALAVLDQLGLQPLPLQAKEGLALVNGTGVMTSIAAHCIYDSKQLIKVAMAVHALLIQGLAGTNQSFHPFIHAAKPHPGQQYAASTMLALLRGSALIRDELDGRHEHRDNDLIQDRYSLRCLPQFMGPIVDGINTIYQQVECEANSVTDNPLIDSDNNISLHGGNFLGQYIGLGMDQLRHHIALLAKHIDVQIAVAVNQHFNRGLPPLLIGNPARRYNGGLQGLQIACNSITPLLGFYANPLTPHFPTHADSFNQNINSQGFGSANLARRSVSLWQQQLAMALMFGVQAVDLRTYVNHNHYDARQTLSPLTNSLYCAVKDLLDIAPSDSKPYVWNDDEQILEHHIAALVTDLQNIDSRIIASLAEIE